MTTPCEQYTRALETLHTLQNDFDAVLKQCIDDGAEAHSDAHNTVENAKTQSERLQQAMRDFESAYREYFNPFPGEVYEIVQGLANAYGKKVKQWHIANINDDGSACGSIVFSSEEDTHLFVVNGNGVKRVYEDVDGVYGEQWYALSIYHDGTVTGSIGIHDQRSIELYFYPFIIETNGRQKVYRVLDGKRIYDCTTVYCAENGTLGGDVAIDNGETVCPFVVWPDGTEKVYNSFDGEYVAYCTGLCMSRNGTLGGTVAFSGFSTEFQYPFVIKPDGTKKVYYTFDNKDVRGASVSISDNGIFGGGVQFMDAQSMRHKYPFTIDQNGVEKVYYTLDGRDVRWCKCSMATDGTLGGMVQLEKTSYPFVITLDGEEKVHYTLDGKGIHDCKCDIATDGTIFGSVQFTSNSEVSYPFVIYPDGTGKVYYTIGNIDAKNCDHLLFKNGLLGGTINNGDEKYLFTINKNDEETIIRLVDGKKIVACHSIDIKGDKTLDCFISLEPKKKKNRHLFYDGEKYTTFPIKPQKKT